MVYKCAHFFGILFSSKSYIYCSLLSKLSYALITYQSIVYFVQYESNFGMYCSHFASPFVAAINFKLVQHFIYENPFLRLQKGGFIERVLDGMFIAL